MRGHKNLKIVSTRRISQVFFFILFIWFCIVSTIGSRFWQLRGWPVNWFLDLDPLAGLGTILATHTLYRGLLWGLATVILTIVFGRFFCGWVCPFGSLHQFFGWVGARGRKAADQIARNQYRKAQGIKYAVLFFFLVMAAIPLFHSTSLQTGLLDPIPLVYRSVNIALLPIADKFSRTLSAYPRQYEGAWLIGLVFLGALFLNFIYPRFYCRFLCPLGALLGILGRFSIWRIGKTQENCRDCKLCDKVCEGACMPWGKIRISECVLCFNCPGICPDHLLRYGAGESKAGEIVQPDVGRRGFLVAAVSGLFAIPLVRLAGTLGTNWNPRIIRPPGALPEEEFLKRCLKCGQCMRVCPTNIIVPGGLDGGIENLWTPVLNFRSGTSGCQLNCIACSRVCPTAAIRPITLSEKLGVEEYAEKGPIRLGTAFVDRYRCLPWSMGIPCIVCQENCPVTPKAIHVKEFFDTIREGVYKIKNAGDAFLDLAGPLMEPGKYASGDFFGSHVNGMKGKSYRILKNTESAITLEILKSEKPDFRTGDRIEIHARLQAPVVDVGRCIGCGTCEHECPVSGLRAIRVSAENETRSRNRILLLKKA